jgi:2-keto-4-pentenoate hydratase/2-oxohepta-3-ene-1,7-dioic acid hydratase in catechol pathway
VAVPAAKLDKVLHLQTLINGDLRQDANTEDLIFSILNLIKTLSEGQTIQPDDVLATGTVSKEPYLAFLRSCMLIRA